jgi:hypothetical protein
VSKKPDYEFKAIQIICHQLASLQPQARRRVLGYVNARVDSLPVVAAVGGNGDGAEDASTEMPLPFGRTADDAAE